MLFKSKAATPMSLHNFCQDFCKRCPSWDQSPFGLLNPAWLSCASSQVPELHTGTFSASEGQNPRGDITADVLPIGLSPRSHREVPGCKHEEK